MVGLRHFLKDPFEYDFRKLNAKLETTEDAQQFGQSLDNVFGRWPSPTILLADSVDEVEPMQGCHPAPGQRGRPATTRSGRS